jgi:predicted ATPase
LFTDIEGSTRLWQKDEVAMRSALSRHDELLRKAIAEHDGVVFSSMGDGMAAAFSSASAAVAAAVVAQRLLEAEAWPTATPVRVRMGLHTGEAEVRDGDYFGTAVNRAARLMAIGHGGQVLCSSQTAVLVGDAGVSLVDLGEQRLRDLDRPMAVFQVGPGSFPSLRSLDSFLGNLPEQATSFVGRDTEMAELFALVGAHRLVTLTGVGGVGKTRLAVQVAAELVGDFPDGVWLVELGPVGDPAAVADALATALGVTPQAGSSVAESIAAALSGRRLLLVVDNCEHVLDAAADLIETILACTKAVKVIATSREGLRARAEHLWPVPSLAVSDGAGSAAVELFVVRARAVTPGFSIDDPDDLAAVVEICGRLDGIALAIELAAARMVSMTAGDVRDRLDDRFRLLSGGRRGLERHQTLRHAVGWSYDLLGQDERMVLNHAGVFSGGFDLKALAVVCDSPDEYSVLDVLDSLVRKSLVTVERAGGHARYGLLETIRSFAEEQLAATGTMGEVRGRHAGYFAAQAVAHFEISMGPDQRVALQWVDVELANLRAGFRWAADQADLATAVAIAAHAAMVASYLQRHEPVGWAEEVLEAATAAEVSQLPRLYAAASLCTLIGRPGDAVAYAETAVALEGDARYDGFEPGWSSFCEAGAHLVAGQVDRFLEICTALAGQPGRAGVHGMVNLLWLLSTTGRAEQALAIADDTLAAARAHGHPLNIAMALYGYGRAFSQADPARALTTFREGVAYARQQRLAFYEALFLREAAGLEAACGNLEQALGLFDTAIDRMHRGGSIATLVETLAYLAMLFDRSDQPEAAATLCGAATNHSATSLVTNLPDTVAHLRVTLGETAFDQHAVTGAAMELADAVAYARHHIQQARNDAASPDSGGA